MDIRALQPAIEQDWSEVHPEWEKLHVPFPLFLSKKRAEHLTWHWESLFTLVN
jgi:hypothetical protein